MYNANTNINHKNMENTIEKITLQDSAALKKENSKVSLKKLHVEYSVQVKNGVSYYTFIVSQDYFEDFKMMAEFGAEHLAHRKLIFSEC